MYKLNGKLLDMINITKVEFFEPIEKLSRNSFSNSWVMKNNYGSIILVCSLAHVDEADKVAKMNSLKEVLKDGTLQINDKHYNVSLFNGFSEKFDLTNFKLVFMWEGAVTTGNYICSPVKPNVTVAVKNVTIDFIKGFDTVSTKLVCGDIQLTTEGTSFNFDVQAERSYYVAQLFGVNAEGNLSEPIEVEFMSGSTAVTPDVPTNVTTVVDGKKISLSFTKPVNATSIDVIIEGRTYVTYDDTITVLGSAYATQYDIKLRSKSVDQNYSEYVTVSVTTGDMITPTLPSNFTFEVLGKAVTISFTKGTNAYSTEFMINNKTYTTVENFIILNMDNFLTEYTFKARSKTLANVYSEYTANATFSTGRDTVIPTVPTDIMASIGETNLKEITISFVKGDNTALTEVFIDGTLHEIIANSLTVIVGSYSTLYPYKLRSKSSTGDYSSWVDTYSITTPDEPVEPIIPTIPTGISATISQDDNKKVIISFTNGENGPTTEILINNETHAVTTNTLEVVMPNYETAYTYKLRAKSVTSHYSDWTAEAIITTLVEPIIPTMPTSVSAVINNGKFKEATITFTSGTNAVLTEVFINGTAHEVTGTSFVIDLPEYETSYTYKLRSKSATGHYSVYTSDFTITTLANLNAYPTYNFDDGLVPSSFVIVGKTPIIQDFYETGSLCIWFGNDGMELTTSSYSFTVGDKSVYSMSFNVLPYLGAYREVDFFNMYIDDVCVFKLTNNDFGSPITQIDLYGFKLKMGVMNTVLIPGLSGVKTIKFEYAKGNNSGIDTSGYNIVVDNIRFIKQDPTKTPSAPTNIVAIVSQSNPKGIEFYFTMGDKAVETEIVINGISNIVNTTYYRVILPSYGVAYPYKIRSKAAGGECSTWVEGSITTGARPVFPDTQTFDFQDGVVPNRIIELHNECKIDVDPTNAENKVLALNNNKPNYVTKVGFTSHVTAPKTVVEFDYYVYTVADFASFNIELNNEEVFRFLEKDGFADVRTNVFNFGDISGATWCKGVVPLSSSDDTIAFIYDSDGTVNEVTDKILIDNVKIKQLGVLSTPTNVAISVSTINTKKVNISFTKSENSMITEVLINGVTYTSTGNYVEVILPAYSTAYPFKLRSKNVFGEYSAWVDGSVTTEARPVVPDTQIFDFQDGVVPNRIIELHNECKIDVDPTNAENKVLALNTDIAKDITKVGFASHVAVPRTVVEFDYYFTTDSVYDYFIVQLNGSTVFKIRDYSGQVTIEDNIYDFENVRSGAWCKGMIPLANIDDAVVFTYDRDASINEVADKVLIDNIKIKQLGAVAQPTNVVATANETEPKKANISFTKGENSTLTEVTINNKIYTTTGTYVEAILPDYNTAYPFTLKSKSMFGEYSTLVEGSVTTGARPTFPANQTFNFEDGVIPSRITELGSNIKIDVDPANAGNKVISFTNKGVEGSIGKFGFETNIVDAVLGNKGIEFDYYFVTERNYDFFIIKLNNSIVFKASGSGGSTSIQTNTLNLKNVVSSTWCKGVIPITNSNDKIEFSYTKDGSGNTGLDNVFIDNIKIGDLTPPTQPTI